MPRDHELGEVALGARLCPAPRLALAAVAERTCRSDASRTSTARDPQPTSAATARPDRTRSGSRRRAACYAAIRLRRRASASTRDSNHVPSPRARNGDRGRAPDQPASTAHVDSSGRVSAERAPPRDPASLEARVLERGARIATAPEQLARVRELAAPRHAQRRARAPLAVEPREQRPAKPRRLRRDV